MAKEMSGNDNGKELHIRLNSLERKMLKFLSL